MPANMVNHLAARHKLPIEDVEKLWSKAKQIAQSNGKEKNYEYVVEVVKRLLKGKLKSEESMKTLADQVLITTLTESEAEIQKMEDQIENLEDKIKDKRETARNFPGEAEELEGEIDDHLKKIKELKAKIAAMEKKK